MLVSLNVGAYFRGGMHAQQCDRPFLRPTPTNARESEPWRWGSGSKLITIRATVYGDLAWGRGKPRPAQCPSTARKPPSTTLHFVDAPLKASQAGALLIATLMFCRTCRIAPWQLWKRRFRSALV